MDENLVVSNLVLEKKQSPEELKKHQACEVTQETVNTAVFQLIMGAALHCTAVDICKEA